MNPAQPPEGILDPQQPYWPANRVGEVTWLRLKGKLTGRPVPGLSENFTSYVKLGDADADRLIANIKKYGQYPQVNQNDKYGGAYNNEAYQKWLVEEFLEKPFREETDKKIEEAAIQSRLKEIQATKDEVKKVETKEEVVAVIEDKVEVLESILQDINPPRNEYQIPDPWEGSYTSGSSAAPQATVKKTKKRGRPKGSTNKTKKKKKAASGGGGSQPPSPPESPESKKQRVVNMVGGKILSTAKNFAKTVLKPSGPAGSGGTAHYGASAGGGSTPSAAGEGPSLFGIGSWLSKKVTDAFKDAKAERARALEAQSNGAEVPAEMLEPGYFLKKSIGYQFGGRAFDTTFGAFIENMPSKQSSKKAGFGDQFDYGENDPNKKKNKKDLPGELASGFRSVNKSLKVINTKLTENIKILGDLVKETTRVSDILEQIMVGMAGMVDLEFKSDIDQEVQQQKQDSEAQGDVVINIDGENFGGLDLIDLIQGIDDIFDLTNRRKNKGLGNQNRRYRNRRRDSTPNPEMRRTPRRGGPKGRFGMLMNMGQLINFSEGGIPQQPVNALVGEAGPEMIVRSGMQTKQPAAKTTSKLAEGGVAPGGMLPSTGIGYGGIKGGEAMGFAQPLATAMDLPMKISGARILSNMGGFLRSVGPLAGVFSGMLMPFLNPIATIFGLNQSAAAAELTQGIPTEKQGINQLAKLFSNIFRVLGIFGGGGGGSTEEDDSEDTSPVTGGAKGLLDFIAKYESGGDYNKIFGGESIKGLTDKTINEVVQIQKAHLARGFESAAIGRYQMMTPEVYARKAGLDPAKDKFSPANQDKMAMEYLKEDGWEDYIAGKLDADTFADNVAGTWAAMPTRNEVSAHQGVGSNKSLVSRTEFMKHVVAAKSGGTGAYKGMVKSFSSNSGDLEGMFEISGPDSGYRVPEDLTHGSKVVGHGVEWLMKFKRSFVILPVENRKYSVSRDPQKTLQRWSEISREAGIESDGMKWDPIQLWKPSEEPASVNDNMDNVFKMFSKPVDVAAPAKEIPTGSVTPINFDRGVKPSGVAILNNTLVHTQQVPVFVPVPVPGPTEYIAANIYESARTMRFMEFVKKLS